MDYCTLFDSGFLARGLAMISSLQEKSADARVFVLCMDDRCESLLTKMRLPGVELISLARFLTPDLARVFEQRTRQEACWTSTPWLIRHVMDSHESDFVTYVDADLYFFSSPQPIFQEMGNACALIIPHRYPARLANLAVRGIYNVQFMPFRNNSDGRRVLGWWADRCLEWCYNRDEEGRFGDQKYLDEWPDRFPGTHVLRHIGAGVAPWNYENYDFAMTPDGTILVSNAPLIFYHFSQFRYCGPQRSFCMGYPYVGTRPIPRDIYQAYQHAIARAYERIRAVDPVFATGIDSYVRVVAREIVRRFLPYRFKQAYKRYVR